MLIVVWWEGGCILLHTCNAILPTCLDTCLHAKHTVALENLPHHPHPTNTQPTHAPPTNTPPKTTHSVADEGLHPLELWGFDHWLCLPGAGACCVRLSAAAQLAAVGMHDGTVQLHSLVRPGVTSGGVGLGGGCLRVLSLADWGYGEGVTGRVAALRWSPDGRALAVRCVV